MNTTLPTWRTSAGTTVHDELVAALSFHRSVLVDTSTEDSAAPVVERYLTEHESGHTGPALVTTTPGPAHHVLGASWKRRTPQNVMHCSTRCRCAARLVWGTVGQRIYTRRMRRVRRRPLSEDETRPVTPVRLGR